MFSKRRYTRKKRSRKPFTKRTSKRARILRPAPVEVVPKPTFDAAGSPIYLWSYVEPRQCTSPTGGLKPGQLQSLRQICAGAIALNADALSSAYLGESSWSCWETVWSQVLQLGKDLPELFRMFANKFSDQPSFACHGKGMLDHRSSALESCLIPVHRRHRMDNVCSNISIADFISFVNGLSAPETTGKSPAIAIDCSNIPPFLPPKLLSLCNIKHLVALDLSGNSVIDDQFMYTLGSVLVTKESSLVVLKVTGCPEVSKKGLLRLLEKTDLAPLSYIETDTNLANDASKFADKFSYSSDLLCPTPVPGTKWKMLLDNDPVHSLVSKYNLAMKIHYLLRNSDLIAEPALLWDIMFLSDPFLNDDPNSQSERAWAQRLHRSRSKLLLPYVYMRDLKMEVIHRCESKSRAAEPLLVFTRVVSDKPEVTATQPRKKIKRVTTSANAYFGI